MRQILALGLLLLTACADQSPDQRAALCPLDAPAAGADQARFDAAAHAYLMAHPEVLMEMSQALRQKQQAAQQEQARLGLSQQRAAIFADPTDPVAGNPAGTVTVVEFFDAECPYCKKLAPDLERLIAETKDLRVIYKEFPILGPGSRIAATAALAAMRQGKYEAFHRALMADRTPEHQLAEPRILDIAKSVGVDVPRLKKDMAAPEIAAKIAATIDLAHHLGINGTPGLIVGDRLVSGAMPYPALVQAVDEARAALDVRPRPPT
jgi:protein-disulfide isomerase